MQIIWLYFYSDYCEPLWCSLLLQKQAEVEENSADKKCDRNSDFMQLHQLLQTLL